MENNHAKPGSSNQVSYGANYYTPPPIYQTNSDFDSSSTQITSYYQAPQIDSDALKAQQEGNRDGSGMYVHNLPGLETEKTLRVYHIYSNVDVSKIDMNKIDKTCDDCKNCLAEKRRREEERRRQDQEDCCAQCLAECAVACCIGCIEGAVRRD